MKSVPNLPQPSAILLFSHIHSGPKALRNTRITAVLALLTLLFFISATRPTGGIIIHIQPFSDMPADQTQYVLNELKKVYPAVELNKPIPLPKKAFYTPRQRYRADTLIDFLSAQTPGGHVTIGLTTKDISTTKGKYADWGVMGLGFCPGSACVVSTFRLSKTDRLAQLFKVSVHELGHTQGLDHCPVKTCFMRDAEGGNPTGEEKEFCPGCKAVLESKGWKFN